MENIKIELELDQLQEIAISNVVAESIREQGILLKAETNQEQKQKKCKHFLKLQIENKCMNEDQKIKYKDLLASSANGKRNLTKNQEKKIINYFFSEKIE
jgi:hypothetical protein